MDGQIYDHEIAKCHVFVKDCAAGEYADLLDPADYIGVCAVFSLPAPVCACGGNREHDPQRGRGAAAAEMPGAHGGTGE